MKFSPKHVQDVNADPPSTVDKNVLGALLTSGVGEGLSDSARIAEEILRHHDVSAVRGKRIGLLGGRGYIGSHLFTVLSDMGISVYNIQPNSVLPYLDYIVNLACPRKTIKRIGLVNGLQVEYKKFTERFRKGYTLGRNLQRQFNLPSSRCLYFSSQSIFDSPASSVYSQCKQIATDEYHNWGWTIFAPGTVFGTFVNLLRTDTVLNKLLYKGGKKGTYVTNACRSIISIYEVVEAVVAFLCGEDIEPWQSWSIGRTHLPNIVPTILRRKVLYRDTGTSLKNFYPDMEEWRVKLYREYLKKFAVLYSPEGLETI